MNVIRVERIRQHQADGGVRNSSENGSFVAYKVMAKAKPGTLLRSGLLQVLQSHCTLLLMDKVSLCRDLLLLKLIWRVRSRSTCRRWLPQLVLQA